MDELIQDAIDELTIELKDDQQFDADILELKVKGAVRDVKLARRYPSTYTDTQITADLTRLYPTIVNVARYDYNKIGAEGQSSSQENGVTRSFVTRESLFSDVMPLARF